MLLVYCPLTLIDSRFSIKMRERRSSSTANGQFRRSPVPPFTMSEINSSRCFPRCVTSLSWIVVFPLEARQSCKCAAVRGSDVENCSWVIQSSFLPALGTVIAGPFALLFVKFLVKVLEQNLPPAVCIVLERHDALQFFRAATWKLHAHARMI